MGFLLLPLNLTTLTKNEFSEDEIDPELRFTGAGILAMANSGPNTNGKSVHKRFKHRSTLT